MVLEGDNGNATLQENPSLAEVEAGDRKGRIARPRG